MTQAEHKQYLIDSITEMELFIDKMIANIYDRRDTIGDKSLNAMYGIMDRKKANIAQFKRILREEHNYVFAIHIN
jgi:hypothetical protein